MIGFGDCSTSNRCEAWREPTDLRTKKPFLFPTVARRQKLGGSFKVEVVKRIEHRNRLSVHKLRSRLIPA